MIWQEPLHYIQRRRQEPTTNEDDLLLLTIINSLLIKLKIFVADVFN